MFCGTWDVTDNSSTLPIAASVNHSNMRVGAGAAGGSNAVAAAAGIASTSRARQAIVPHNTANSAYPADHA